MALTDIIFIEGDDQSIILKIPTDTPSSFVDINGDGDEFLYLLTLSNTGTTPYFAYIG